MTTQMPDLVRAWPIPARVDWCLRQPNARDLLIDLIRAEKAQTAEVAASIIVCRG